jgi:hypothetical protein
MRPCVSHGAVDRLEADSYCATRALLDDEEPPDALIASAEQYGEGATRACWEGGCASRRI